MTAFDYRSATNEERLAEAARRAWNVKAGRAPTDDGQFPAAVVLPPLDIEESDDAPTPHLDAMIRVQRILEAWAPDASKYSVTVVAGEPPSKARPRMSSNGRVYSSSKQRLAERTMHARLAADFPVPFLGNVAVVCGFYRKDHHRVDVDNLLKHVLDAANRTVFLDDYQVTALSGYLELDAEHPRTVFGVASYDCTMDRRVDLARICEQCGVAYIRANNHKKQKYCSRNCACIVARRTSLIAKPGLALTITEVSR